MSTRAQCEVKGCSAAAAKNLPCCRDHKCEEESCTSTVALSEDKKRSFDLCPSHKCAYPTCGLRRMPGFNGCSGSTDHTCQLPKCQNIIADHDRVVCVSHIALECSEEGCTSLAAKKNTSDRYYYCSNHIKCKSCANNRLLHSAGCSTHTCWRRACYKPIKNGAYCKEHKCSAETCLQAPQVNEAGIFRKTCFIHTCQFPNCSEVNKTEKIGYCKTHGCAQEGCARYRCDHLDLSPTAEHLCLQHHDEKLKSEEQARIDEKMKADEKVKAEKDKAEAAEKAKADEKEKAEAEKKAKAEEKAKAEKDKAEAAEKEKAEKAEKAEAEKKAKAEAEKKKAEAEEKKKTEEKAKAEEKAKLEEKEKLESKSLAVKAPMTNGNTSISTTTMDDLKKLLEAIQKSQQSSFADVKATLKQIDEFDRQTILALAKRNK